MGKPINANMNELLHKELSYQIVGCFYEIRNGYGPGQKEIVYCNLLAEKLTCKGISFEREKRVKIYSNETGKTVGVYQPDFIAEDVISIELKSSRYASVQDEKQLYYYLRNSKYELGYLVNFSTPKIYIKRIVYSNSRKPFLKNTT
jgi:GxxExxY protein